MAQDLHQVPPDANVWKVGSTYYLVWFVPNTSPPVPVGWEVSADDIEALGIKRADRTFPGVEPFRSTGIVLQGSSRELLNTTDNPIDQIKSNYATQVKVKPWLADPEVMAVWTAALMEGRDISDAEIQGTEWWRTHTQTERQWLTLNAADPATANQMIADNRLQVADLFRQAGVDNASQSLINQVADNWTTGKWSQAYAGNQIRLLSDPYLQGSLDPELKGMRTNLDTTRDRESTVRQMINEWLGPAYGQYSAEDIAKWASRLRQNTDAQIELEDHLRQQRLAMFPTYTNPNLTYEDIASPWRGVWQQVLGSIADEKSSLFTGIVATNDLATAQHQLTQWGLDHNNAKVGRQILGDMNSAFGGQVRHAIQVA